MQIKKKIYEKIMALQNINPPETGGILGGLNGIVTAECFDRGIQSDRMCSYIPNTQRLNKIIKQWQSENIIFMGIYHTHFWGVETLSESDEKYIYTILKCMPPEIEKLYFPVIVMPDRKMVCYSASQIQEKLVIDRDELIVL